MGQALYRKYRSKSLSEIVGQEHITQTLEKALKSGRISHAYLFTGPRGVGKTSIARIIAHTINGIPYVDDQTHLDIIEIDAASNRRIDEIRDLREKVFVSPASAKYKVYIIDEVHMLTKEAFNALLKTLEEPPAHVVFVLATTEIHKLPETIVSRTQRFTFRPVEKNKVVKHLRTIAKQEKIDVTDKALELIAEHGEGSFRDSISLLDQASNRSDKVDEAEVLSLLGVPPQQALDELIRMLAAPDTDTATLFGALEKLFAQGFQASAISQQLGKLLRARLLSGDAPMDHNATISLLGSLIDVPSSRDPERLLEIILLDAQTKTTKTTYSSAAPTTPSANEPSPKATSDQAADKTDTETTAAEPTRKKPTSSRQTDNHAKPKTTAPKKPNTSKQTLDSSTWPEVLAALKTKHNTLYSFVRMAQPEFSDGTVKLAFAFAFHNKRVNEAKNQKTIKEVIESVTGQQLEVVCVYDPDLPTAAPTEPLAANEPEELPAGGQSLTNISNIFGGAELLES